MKTIIILQKRNNSSYKFEFLLTGREINFNDKIENMNNQKAKIPDATAFQSKRSFSWLIICGMILMLTACADSITFKEAIGHDIVGFWYGLWHGFILPVSFIVSLFDPDVAIYAIYNNRGWYNLGFLLGASTSIGGSSRAKC